MSKKKAWDTYSDRSLDKHDAQLYWLKDKSHADLIGFLERCTCLGNEYRSTDKITRSRRRTRYWGEDPQLYWLKDKGHADLL
eukprot:11927226-Heterocapsa_arctica.AAC.1